MKPDPDIFLPLIDATRGHCHSCQHSREYPFPSGSRYWCRAFALEMSPEQRRRVSDCPRWKPLRLTDGPSRRRHAGTDPLLASIIEAEDAVFARLKVQLTAQGLDLGTILRLAQPGLSGPEAVRWVDDLADEAESELSLDEVLREMRALGYDSVCDVVEQLTYPKKDEDVSDRAAGGG